MSVDVIIVMGVPIRIDLLRIAKLLQRAGYVTLEASGVELVMALAVSEAPCLVICDMGVSDDVGFAVAEKFKADPDLYNIPLVAIGGFPKPVGHKAYKKAVLAAGFVAYFGKVFPEYFVPKLQKYIPIGNSIRS